MPSNPLDRAWGMFVYRQMISARSGPGNTAEDLGPTRAIRRADRVTVSVPARLHFGFLGLNGGLGRRFGSLGLALEAPLTRVVLSAAPRFEVSGPETERAKRHLQS